MRYKEVKTASTLGILGNIFLCIIKGIIGFITRSEAMIADSFNSAGDIVSSLMTYIGNKIANKPRDEEHNLGYGKAEYVFSMLVSIIIMLTAFYVIKDSIMSLLYKSEYSFSPFLILICIICIVTKLSLYLYTNNLSKKYHNLLIKANSKDHRNDILITAINLISCILAFNKIYIFDGIAGIIIGLFILYSGIKIFKESYEILMDKCISSEIKDEVFKIIESHKEIKKVIHFNSTPVGYKYQISFTIYVDGNMSTFESHKIADDLEKEIDKSIDEIYLTVIHVNPWKEK